MSSALPDPGERSVLPRVSLPRAGLSVGAIALGSVAAGLVLFSVLDARRRAITAPTVAVRSADAGTSNLPPLLYVPPETVASAPLPVTPAPAQSPAPIPRAPERYPVYPPSGAPPVIVQRVDPVPQAPERPPRTSGGAALVLDTSQPRETAAPAASPGTTPTEASSTASRVRAGAIANRTTTVPQGTLIPAVLETAFNSTRGGFARALVQRDIYGFDGRRVLIPRGSRLIGEYGGDTTVGQNRALVAWTRLIRPDGATIAIGSPATDPVGTGGIRAKVNSHFFTRFGGAILQSVLDVGVNLASRSSNSPVVVALPGSIQGSTQTVTRQTEVPPTLSVRQGTSVSVFVARDLDFTEVEDRP